MEKKIKRTPDKPLVSSLPIHALPLWEEMKKEKSPITFELELTARCNNDCRHCYINLPAGDRAAKARELTFDEIMKIAGESVSMGALWCLLTGGEPLLREDFVDIYLGLKKKGLLVSVFTDANLVTKEHAALFKKYPPRDIEVSVYGVTRETYEKVTRKQGSFATFRGGLDLLLESGVKVRLKAMALRSNAHELPEIARFCRERTKDYFKFDPLLNLRFDGDRARNEMIRAERLSGQGIAALESADSERMESMKKNCELLIGPECAEAACNHLFHCGAGNGGFYISYDGQFRLCSSLLHPDCVYDLRKGSLAEAWREFIPKVRAMRSEKKSFLEKCRACSLVNLCLWCPAHAYLETGEMDASPDYFCEVAEARAGELKKRIKDGSLPA